MDAVTYPHEETRSFLDEHVVAYKARIDEDAGLAEHLGVAWTPGLVWLAPDGRVGHRNVGYFEPEEFLAECLFGCGRVAAGASDWETARERFEETTRRWPGSHAAPAARYWAGVADKKATGDPAGLIASWKKLLADHPGSAWAMKVSFLRDE